MAKVRSKFMTAGHGLRFVNRFDFSEDFRLPFSATINLGDIVYGLCGGMCFAALDYFYKQAPLPEFSDPDELPRQFLLYLWDRQIDSMRLPVIPKVIEWMMRDDIDVAKRTSRYEVPKLRRRLDQGQPTVLALIRAKTGESPTKNHQVLALGYDFNPINRDMTIDLYDPNHPGTEQTLSMNLASPSRGINISQSSGEPLRGFFVIKYKRQEPPIL